MREIWADIYGFDGRYQVSTWGRVRGAKGIMKPYKNSKGYLKVGLTADGVCYKRRVSRLVADAFLERQPYQTEVNHKDGNKANNSVTNLEWVSGEENRLFDRIQEDFWQTSAKCIEIKRRQSGEEERKKENEET